MARSRCPRGRRRVPRRLPIPDVKGMPKTSAARSWLRPIVAVLGGPDATDGLWPLIGLTFVSNIATSGFYGYVGVWAITRLGAAPGIVGVLLLVNAAFAIFSGYVGGAFSDRVGRKPVVVWCLAGQAAAIGACSLVGHRLPLGFALVVIASTIGTSAWAARTSLVPDLVPPERRSLAFSTIRTVNNVAGLASPALVGILLVLSGWTAAFATLSVLGLASAVYSQLFLPAGQASAAGQVRDRPRGRAVILRDRPYLIMLAATLMALLVYTAYTSVLPIIIVSHYGYSAASWGFLAVVNPAVVILAQGRLTLAVRNWAPGLRVALGTLLMGLPWLLLLASHSLVVILAAILIFVCGEMMWAPASQAMSADLAPDAARGAYQGAYGAIMSIALAVGPVVSLSILEHNGPAFMWQCLAAIAAAAAIAGFAAIQAGLAALPDKPPAGRGDSSMADGKTAVTTQPSDEADHSAEDAWSSATARPTTERG
jgi:predicted MFS family arabinose efflux permease